MEAILALIVDPLALWLESFALSPSVWYLTSRQHIIETFFVTLYFILTSLSKFSYLSSNLTSSFFK